MNRGAPLLDDQHGLFAGNVDAARRRRRRAGRDGSTVSLAPASPRCCSVCTPDARGILKSVWFNMVCPLGSDRLSVGRVHSCKPALLDSGDREAKMRAKLPRWYVHYARCDPSTFHSYDRRGRAGPGALRASRRRGRPTGGSVVARRRHRPLDGRSRSSRHATSTSRKYGAVGDGKASCTAAIRKAIDACAAAGGGHVIVPDGRFLTGAVHLQEQRQPAPRRQGDARVQRRSS